MTHDLYFQEGKESEGRLCKKCTLRYDLTKQRDAKTGIKRDLESCDGKPPEGINIGGVILGS